MTGLVWISAEDTEAEIADAIATMEHDSTTIRDLRGELAAFVARAVEVHGTSDPYRWPASAYSHGRDLEDRIAAVKVGHAESAQYLADLRALRAAH